MYTSTSATQFGLPLKSPSTQTILPIVEQFQSSARVLGYIVIASTEFDGTETSYEVVEGVNAPISSVTLPTSIAQNDHPLVPQYMAVVFSYDEAKQQPWSAWPNFFTFETSGFYSNWSLSKEVRRLNYGAGNLISSLTVKMDYVNPAGTIPDPEAPPVQDGTFKWVTNIDLSTVGPECSFFDFNWMDLLLSEPPAGVNNISPVRITTLTNPAGFKAAILQRPTTIPGGAIVFDTVRIVRLQDNLASGSYEFDFQVTWMSEGVETTADATLTLNLVTDTPAVAP